MQDRQIHDLCHAVAWRALEIVRPLVRDDEARDAYAEFYEIARQEIERYEEAKVRQESRLHPKIPTITEKT